MRKSIATGLAGLLVTVTMLLSPTATAAPPTTYSGEFAGKILYTGVVSGTPPSPGIAGGTWSVKLHGTSAKAVFVITIDGAPHVAYTFPGMKQAPVGPGTAFSVYGATEAGLLTVTVTGDHMTYTIAPYHLDGLEAASVTYPGTVDAP